MRIDPKLKWMSEPSGKIGRQQMYREEAIQSCLTLKVLFKMPLRQMIEFVESLLKLMGLDWKVPDFSTLCRCQKELRVKISYQGSPGPLHLLIDSTGIKVEGSGLLKQISFERTIASVTADGVYDTYQCHAAIADYGANAVIPFRKNAQLHSPNYKTDNAG